MRRICTALVALALVGCASDEEDPYAADTDAGAVEEPPDETTGDSDLKMRDLKGTWHGQIGEGYRGGCLCLTLEKDGTVGEPSGITMGFDVAGGDTLIVDAEAREVDITTLVMGTPFHIRDAYVDDDAETIEGRWEADPPSAFDDDIVLDRDGDSCQDRTGLSGAPC